MRVVLAHFLAVVSDQFHDNGGGYARFFEQGNSSVPQGMETDADPLATGTPAFACLVL